MAALADLLYSHGAFHEATRGRWQLVREKLDFGGLAASHCNLDGPAGGGDTDGVTIHIALLRGINVGRNKRIAMARLRELMADLGYPDAKTHLQSGNVVFDGGRRGADTIARAISKRIADDVGLDVQVVVRTRAELTKVVTADPLRDVVKDPTRYFVTLETRPLKRTRAPSVDASGASPALQPARYSEQFCRANPAPAMPRPATPVMTAATQPEVIPANRCQNSTPVLRKATAQATKPAIISPPGCLRQPGR